MARVYGPKLIYQQS